MPFAQQNTVIGHSLLSNSSSKCPFNAMCLCFYELSIPRKSASLVLGLYSIFLGSFCQIHVLCKRTFHKETHYIGHCLSSYSASKCPISSIFVCFNGLSIPRTYSLAYINSMCLCFYELSIAMKIVSLFLGLY